MKKFSVWGAAVLLIGLALVPLLRQDKEPSPIPIADCVSESLIESRGVQPGCQLFFEPNRGQFESDVRFVSRGRGYTLSLLAGKARLVMRKPVLRDASTNLRQGASSGAGASVITVAAQAGRSDHTKSSTDRLTIRFIGASLAALMEGEGEGTGSSHYLIGGDATRWLTDIPNFARVRYADIYPGIDLIFHGTHGFLEYDFVLEPGADPTAIRLGFGGIKSVDVVESGDLVLHSGKDAVVFRAPHIYQESESGTTTVDGQYTLYDFDEVGFEIGSYDASRVLVIDPILQYSTYYGGSSSDKADGVGVDKEGNIYIAGSTGSDDFPLEEPWQSTRSGGEAFVVKLTPDGQQRIYSTFIGGRGGDYATDIAVDEAGNAYIVGTTHSEDDVNTPDVNEGFPVLNGFQTAGGDAVPNAFVSVFDPTGKLLYSTYVGSSGDEEGRRIAVDASGNAYVVGVSIAAMGEPKLPIRNAFQSQRRGYGIDGFVTKIDPSKEGDASLVYSSFLSGLNTDECNDISVDPNGHAYVTGFTRSDDFPTAAALYPTIKGDRDAFVVKLDPTGSTAVYSTYLGGHENDSGAKIVADANGNAYVLGMASAGLETTPGAFNEEGYPGVGGGAFIAKINPLGTGFEYSTYLAPVGAAHLVVDRAGRAIIYGSIGKYDASGNFYFADIFASLKADGSDTLYTDVLFGKDKPNLWVADVEIGPQAQLFLTGHTRDTGLPLTKPIQDHPGGFDDAFIMKVERDVIVVNSTGDAPDNDWSDGRCWTGDYVTRDGVREPERTLRAAIETVNELHLFSPVQVVFDIPNRPQPVIRVQSELPTIEAPISIDATTQPNNSGVAIDGELTQDADGLRINADDVRIRGLTVHSFPSYGLHILGGSGHEIIANRIGFDRTGESPKYNGLGGIKVAGDARDCTIGGLDDNVDANYIGGGVLLVGSDVARVGVLRNYFEVTEATWSPATPIDLSTNPDGAWDGPTVGDWSSTESNGPNSLIAPPRILSITHDQVTGVTRPNSTVILYDVEATGPDRKRYFARRAEPITDWPADDDGYFQIPVLLESFTEIAATVTDVNGNTSELSQLRRPVIFLPGVAGSWLKDASGRNLWPPFESLNLRNAERNERIRALAMDEAGNDVYGEVRPYRVLEYFFGTDMAYGAFLTNLEQLYPGQVDNAEPAVQDVWRWPYDWRKSPGQLADQLKNFIDGITGTDGVPAWSNQVDIVAHSMGGLVGSAYIRKYPQHSRNHLHRFVTVGTPYLGTPQTAAGHTKGYIFGLDNKWIGGLWPDWSMILQIFREMPGTYTLLPSRAYFDTWEYVHYLEDLDGEQLWDWDRTRFFLGDGKPFGGLARNITLLDKEQAAVHDVADDWRNWQGPPQIFRLVGSLNGSTTIAWEVDRRARNLRERFGFEEIRREDDRDTDALVHYRTWLRPLLGAGDGTVTLESATLGRRHRDAGQGGHGTDYSGVEDSRWVNDFELFYCGHVELMSAECADFGGQLSSHYRLLEILASGYRVVEQRSGIGKAVAPAQETREILYVSGAAPISVVVEDGDGSFTGPASPDSLESVHYGLPDLSYWATPFQVAISAPSSSDYTVKVSAPHDLTTVLFTRLQVHDAHRDNLLFDEQLLAQSGGLRFSLTAGGTDLNAQLEVDANGDGTYEQTVAPAAHVLSTSIAPAVPTPRPTVLHAEAFTSASNEQEVTLVLPDVGGPIWQWELWDVASWIEPAATFGETPASIPLKLMHGALVRGVHVDTLNVSLSTGTYTTTGSAVVRLIVRDVEAELTRIDVEPGEQTLRPGDTHRFTAHGFDQIDEPYYFEPVWSASGGAIDSTGLFQASSMPGTYTIQATNHSGTISGDAIVYVSESTRTAEDETVPTAFILQPNYPNPFNPITTMRYALPRATHVRLAVIDILGREVRILATGAKAPGFYDVSFDASGLPSGVYFYRLEAGDFVQARSMVFVR